MLRHTMVSDKVVASTVWTDTLTREKKSAYQIKSYVKSYSTAPT